MGCAEEPGVAPLAVDPTGSPELVSATVVGTDPDSSLLLEVWSQLMGVLKQLPICHSSNTPSLWTCQHGNLIRKGLDTLSISKGNSAKQSQSISLG